MTIRVLIAVTHLLGAGHLTRAAALARAFAARGHIATLVSGGMPSRLIASDDIQFVQLPPVRTNGIEFRALLDEDGQPAGEDLLSRRREVLISSFRTTRPDVVITELFPFGRRVLADEYLALLNAARQANPRPVVVCSIRDILVAPTKPGRIDETHERLSRFYDAVLVHGDPDLVPLDASWPVDDTIRALLHYTGYVDERAVAPASAARDGIVVSGGSSAASLPLYRAAIEAAYRIEDRAWRLLVGNGVPDAEFEALRSAAPPHMTVERARRDFRAMLGHAALSISQAGYNTTVDLLRTRVKSILVPFEEGQETEQRLRAERLRTRGLAAVILEADLTADRLVLAIRESLESRPGPLPALALDGAQRSVAVVEDLVRSRPAVLRRLDWSALDDALQQGRDAGREIGFWWRDDDAVAATPQLQRLLDLAGRYEVPLALAVIPRQLEASLATTLSEERLTSALVHGLAHTNHAPPHDKKAEFGDHRFIADMAEEAAEALRLTAGRLGSKLLPVFVPPWNRIAAGLLPALPAAGYRGVSAFNDRRPGTVRPGLVQVNAHIDPIDWRGRRGLVDPQDLVAGIAETVGRRLTGRADPREPVGILSHHLVHREEVWSFCDALLEYLSRNKVRFRDPVRVFSDPDRIAAGD